MARSSSFGLSAFGDEIDDDVDAQLDVLAKLELRTAWGKRFADPSDQEIDRLAAACNAHSMRVSCIGSCIGKSTLAEPLEATLAELRRILELADRVGTDIVRIFSFRVPELGREPEHFDGACAAQLSAVANMALQRDVVLVMENETGMVGDTSEWCPALLQGVDNPSLKSVWDIGNFSHTGVDRPVDRGWLLLGDYVAHVQVKDTRFADRAMTMAGKCDGQARKLLGKLLMTSATGASSPWSRA